MDWREIRDRITQKLRQRADLRRLPDFNQPAIPAGPASAWPVLPRREDAPTELTEPLRRDIAEILAGRWLAFGHIRLQVSDPPNWFTDYSLGRALPTRQPAFQLNHRELPHGADSKLVWELSRWHQVMRLAQAAWVLGDAAARDKALVWLDDWVKHNPPYLAWNWTSALEAGMRLVNFAWIEALLLAAGAADDRLAPLRQQLLPAHVWYAWRHKSFGSSANNHLLGELAGLVVALARWPALERWGPSLAELQRRWEREVLAQFAPDGGNGEQALNYQLYSWELCWVTRLALLRAGKAIAPAVEERLRRAADFFVSLQVPSEPWDYGDSDSATVSPVYADETHAVDEWYRWFSEPGTSPALRFWMGDPPEPVEPAACQPGPGDWLVFPDSGQAVCWCASWQVRWDLSPLGYLSMASHGHLDALHASFWLRGVALIVDPGTGAYFGDTRLRTWLASWGAHNGPHVPGVDYPRRLGPFLWQEHHQRPRWRTLDDHTFEGELTLPHGTFRRRLVRVYEDSQDGWIIEDEYQPAAGVAPRPFLVRWQFPPGTTLEASTAEPRMFRGRREEVPFTITFESSWQRVRHLAETIESTTLPVRGELVGICSSAFRRIESGPVLEVTAEGAAGQCHRTILMAVPA